MTHPGTGSSNPLPQLLNDSHMKLLIINRCFAHNRPVTRETKRSTDRRRLAADPPRREEEVIGF